MPYSEITGKKTIQKWFSTQKDIKTIVDVGPGVGTYPKLLGPDYTYVGIEIWAPYIEQFNLHELYDELIVADIRHVVLPKGDCVIFGDIVEHLKKEDAVKVLRRAEKKYKHIVVSLPVGPYVQGSFQGNKFESHLSYWEWKELCNLFEKYDIKEREENNAVFIK